MVAGEVSQDKGFEGVRRLKRWLELTNRPAPALVLREDDRERLAALTRSSTVPAELAQRERIVLLAADGQSNTAIASGPPARHSPSTHRCSS
jgi:hypothetical protein